MEAVRRLLGIWRAAPGTFGIEAMPIAADDLGAGVLREPRCHACRWGKAREPVLRTVVAPPVHDRFGIRTGPVLERAMRGRRHAVTAMAAQGNNMIVDEVVIEARTAQEYLDFLRPFDLHPEG